VPLCLSGDRPSPSDPAAPCLRGAFHLRSDAGPSVRSWTAPVPWRFGGLRKIPALIPSPSVPLCLSGERPSHSDPAAPCLRGAFHLRSDAGPSARFWTAPVPWRFGAQPQIPGLTPSPSVPLCLSGERPSASDPAAPYLPGAFHLRSDASPSARSWTAPVPWRFGRQPQIPGLIPSPSVPLCLSGDRPSPSDPAAPCLRGAFHLP